jgi:hypothetical protein
MPSLTRKGRRNGNLAKVLPWLGKSLLVAFFFLMVVHTYSFITRTDIVVREPTRTNADSPQSSSSNTQKVLNQQNGGPTEDLSKTATVMGMATNYRLQTFRQFVGSLRKSGYMGNIILGVSPEADMPDNVKNYLKSWDVVMKHIQYVNCTHNLGSEGCAHPYQDIKLRWSRFPLLRDWLQECDRCTGPVLVSDVRDAYFQENPFGRSKSTGQNPPPVEGLQVFEENPIRTTDHWLVKWPVKECKGIEFSKPMLCSGTTIGTREAMLRYLTDMYEGKG